MWKVQKVFLKNVKKVRFRVCVMVTVVPVLTRESSACQKNLF